MFIQNHENMNKYLPFTVLFCLFFISCEDDHCQDQQLPTYSLEEEYSCENTKYQLSIDLDNGFKIIHDQEVYENLVGGSCDVQIDFERFDLIIGKHGLTNGNVRIGYEFRQLCDVITPILSVTFFQNLTDIAPTLTYHVLVDKLREGGNISVKINETF
jgi:hypothetical protein